MQRSRMVDLGWEIENGAGHREIWYGKEAIIWKTTTADESEREFTNVFYKYDIGDLEVIPEIR